MKIVIDIPDSTIADLKRKKNRTEVDNAVLNGTPLPKEHGRLIDADRLFEQDKKEWICPNNAPFISTDYAHIFAEIDAAPTIIEP